MDIVYNKRVNIENLDILVKKLKEILGDEWVSTKEPDLLAYSKDAQFLSLHWSVRGIITAKPHVIVWPENEDQISKILKLGNEMKIPIVPFGEGSGVVGGAVAIFGGVVIDMKRMTNIIDINDKNLTVTVQTGINGVTLGRILEEKGYRIGHVPQSYRCSSLGGWIGHRAAGQFSTKYGKIEDIVVSLKVVLPTGEIINTKLYSRSSNGPQVEKNFLGSEGTLGVVTQATLKMWPLPENQAGISFIFESLSDALEFARVILRRQVYPAVIRIYDKIETGYHFPEITEAKNKILAIFVCEGTKDIVEFEVSQIIKVAQGYKTVRGSEEPIKKWFESRFDVSALGKIAATNFIGDTCEVSCMWDRALELYNGVIEKLKKVPGLVIASAHASHFYTNGVCFYFTLGGVAINEQTPTEFYRACIDAAMEGTLNAGGSISHHHGIGLIRSKWMEKEHGAMLDVMKKIKKVIDPNNIMNPGKLYEELPK